MDFPTLPSVGRFIYSGKYPQHVVFSIAPFPFPLIEADIQRVKYFRVVNVG